jgi:hypothetical protein
MSLDSIAQTVVDAAITWTVYGVLTLLWARRKLLPFLRKHAPSIARALDDLADRPEA